MRRRGSRNRSAMTIFQWHYFSVAYEQYQNGPAESSIHSLSLLSRTQMVESGLMVKFWYRALVNAKDTRNVTYHDHIKTTPHYFIHREPKNLSKFRAFECRTYPYLNEDRQEKGKHIPQAVKGVNLIFFQESSWYVIYIPT